MSWFRVDHVWYQLDFARAVPKGFDELKER